MSEYDDVMQQLDEYLLGLAKPYHYDPVTDPDGYRAFSVGVMRSMIYTLAVRDREHFDSYYGKKAAT